MNSLHILHFITLSSISSHQQIYILLFAFLFIFFTFPLLFCLRKSPPMSPACRVPVVASFRKLERRIGGYNAEKPRTLISCWPACVRTHDFPHAIFIFPYFPSHTPSSSILYWFIRFLMTNLISKHRYCTGKGKIRLDIKPKSMSCKGTVV